MKYRLAVLLHVLLFSFFSTSNVLADEATAQHTANDQVSIASEIEQPRFSRHVVAVFSRLGCNAGGGCHGAPKGQNGFRLSLWGSHPEVDYTALVRQAAGRRVNRLNVDASLLLLKPSMQIPHQGGKKLESGSHEFEIVHRWLSQGAKLDDVAASHVKNFEIEPVERFARAGESYSIRVRATFADGSSEDVTHLCSFEVVEESVAEVDRNGRVTVKASGETPIFVRYRGTPLVSQVFVPVEPRGSFPTVKPKNFIDELVLAKLKQLNIHPADVCDDATFLRRASLDIAAELPTPDEVRVFLAEKDFKKREKKIDELLRRHGHAGLWATIWCDMIRPVRFNHNHALRDLAESKRMHDWIRARIEENTPYDEFVERIITATSYEGRTQEEWIEEIIALGRENIERRADMPTYAKRRTLDLYWQRDSGEVLGVRGSLKVGYLFLGMQLMCAQCHRHPHDVWQQEDVLDFANFFNQTRGAAYPSSDKQLKPEVMAKWKALQDEAKKLREEAKKIREKANPLRAKNRDEFNKLNREAEELNRQASKIQEGTKRFGTAIYHLKGNKRWVSVTSPLGRQQSRQFRLPLASEPIEISPDQDPRQIVLQWFRDHQRNPYFARAMVNRVWAHYMGRGIVDPTDNLSAFNPPTHPQLLDRLANDFVEQKYDLRWLHRIIASSRTYQQSSAVNETNRTDEKNYARFHLRRLPAEVLVDALNHAAGGKVTYPDDLFMAKHAKAIDVAGETVQREGRREKATLTFAFDIFGRPKRDIMMMCDCERDNGTTVMHTLYMANNPRVREKIAAEDGRVAQVLQQFDDDRRRTEELFLWVVSRPPKDEELKVCLDYVNESPDKKRGFEDVMWSLLNTREFILQH